MALWERVIGVNLYGVIHGIRAFLPIMEQQGVGHIVNTASMAGLTALPGAAPYNVTKHGVVALSEGLFLELAASGSPIKVSALCPGFVKTDLAVKEPAESGTSLASMIGGMLRTGVETGIPAIDVADAVLDAIVAERFWILTHPEMSHAPVERMERAESQTNPSMFGLA
jgi:NAD(P)-dependent dehydrogenase (short-subunit alcohol dehydrogenase family)